MYKSNDLIGKPVISLETDKQIGFIKDLILFWNEGMVKYFYLETGTILNKNDIAVPIKNFKRLAGDWVPLVSLEALEKIHDDQGERWSDYKGRKIISNWGREIGFLAEIIFSFPDGKIDCIEISDGLLKDFINGREKVPLKAFETFSENMIIIKEDLGGDN
ncbi:MAG: PRC-barrel domain-containing protein [Clostridia bacterium]|nr:PRC-barrel domain-containing protein [Clostridia bacterium]